MTINIFHRHILLVSLSFLIALPATSFSDDTIVADYGKTVSPIKTNEITMLEEEVIITIDDLKEKRATFPLRKAHVKCRFIFQNTSNAPIEAVVGFPGNIQNGVGTYSLPIVDFVTLVEGKSHKVEVKKEIIKEYKGEGIQEFRNWYTWKMTFPANSKVKVDNSYNHYLSAPSGYEPFYLSYELSTGANWRDKIGAATIKVIYKTSDDLEKRVCGIKPKGWIRNQNEIVWRLKDIEPTKEDNIEICERNLGIDYPPEMQKRLLFRKELRGSIKQ